MATEQPNYFMYFPAHYRWSAEMLAMLSTAPGSIWGADISEVDRMSASGSAQQAVAGNLRVLAIAGPQRRTGALAGVPTLIESGLNASGVATWRAIFGAKGITPAQVSFWEDALGSLFAVDEWKNRMAEDNVTAPPLRGKELAKYLEDQYAYTRGVLLDLGIARYRRADSSDTVPP